MTSKGQRKESPRVGPKRPRAHVLETLSRQYVESILPAEWICRRADEDYGLDLRVEIVAGEEVTGREFSIQLKATDTLKTSGGDVLHRCSVPTALYFLRRPEPVLYVVYDAQEDAGYWLWMQPYLESLDETRPNWRDQRTVQIRIPLANRLTVGGVAPIADAVHAWWARALPSIGWDYAPSPRAARRPFQVPPDLPTFTGRESYLRDLDAALQPATGQTVGLVGLRGMAGAGKSTLAIHAAHRWGDRFRDGVVWVDLRQRDVASALRHIAATYGYGDQAAREPNVEGLAALVRTVLHGREALIILDNAESIPAEQFATLLSNTERCVTLVTSRRTFSELTRHGKVLPVGQMEKSEAEALLVRVLGPPLSESDAAARSALIERLGGLPLALDIAARRIAERGWTTADYASRLEEASSLITELNLPLATRSEESVALAFSLSYEVLDAEHRRLFRALGVMAEGGFTPVSIAETLGQELTVVERRLEGLTALSLVRLSGMKGRYDLHPLLKEYSRTLARETDEWESLRNAHLAYYTAYADDNARDYAALEAELANLMMAAEWSWSSGESKSVLTLAEQLYHEGKFLDLRGHALEAVRLLTWAVETAHTLEEQRLEGIHLHGLGCVYQDLGQVEKAIQFYEQALAITREAADCQGEGRNLGGLGRAYYDLGQVEKAIQFYEQALAIDRKIGHRQEQARVLGNLGLAYHDLGQVEKAIQFHEQALVIDREIGYRQGEGRDLGNLGLAYYDLGQIEKAIQLHEQALAIDREIGYRQGQGQDLGNLGLTYHDLGQVEKAVQFHEQALAIDREIGYRQGEGDDLHNLGLAYAVLGQPESAVELYQAALSVYRDIGYRHGQWYALQALGEAYCSLAQLDRGVECCIDALGIANEIGAQSGQSYCLLTLGEAYLALADMTNALQCFRQALDFDMPETAYQAALALGIASLQQRDPAANGVFADAVSRCRAMLKRTVSLYLPRYTLGAALVGQAVCDPRWTEEDERAGLLKVALSEYRQALEICSAPGVVRDAIRNLEMIQAAGMVGLEPVFELLEAHLKA